MESWPFTDYRLFAHLHDPDQVKTYGLAFFNGQSWELHNKRSHRFLPQSLTYFNSFIGQNLNTRPQHIDSLIKKISEMPEFVQWCMKRGTKPRLRIVVRKMIRDDGQWVPGESVLKEYAFEANN